MRRIVLCEQAGTGLRMMRKEWQRLGHSAPILRNDRSQKAFELFIPGLDREFDAASNLMKAMFKEKNTSTPRTDEQVKAQEAQVEAQDFQFNLTPLEITILGACRDEPRTSRELLTAAGYSSRTGNFKRGIDRLLTYRLIQMTTPGKPTSAGQKYRLTQKGQHLLAETKH